MGKGLILTEDFEDGHKDDLYSARDGSSLGRSSVVTSRSDNSRNHKLKSEDLISEKKN